jgi:hypothetical protein
MAFATHGTSVSSGWTHQVKSVKSVLRTTFASSSGVHVASGSHL